MTYFPYTDIVSVGITVTEHNHLRSQTKCKSGYVCFSMVGYLFGNQPQIAVVYRFKSNLFQPQLLQKRIMLHFCLDQLAVDFDQLRMYGF